MAAARARSDDRFCPPAMDLLHPGWTKHRPRSVTTPGASLTNRRTVPTIHL